MYIKVWLLIKSVLCQRSNNTTLRGVPKAAVAIFFFFTIAGALLIEGSEELKLYAKLVRYKGFNNQDFPEALLETVSYFWSSFCI